MHLNRRYERCQHPYIHPRDMKREKKYGADWRINLSRSNPPQKNQARYYDLFKCFQLKHLLKYCSMGSLTSKAVRDHWANKSWMTPYCCQYFMYHFVPKNLLVPETRLRRLLQLKLVKLCKTTPWNKMNYHEMECSWSGVSCDSLVKLGSNETGILEWASLHIDFFLAFTRS